MKNSISDLKYEILTLADQEWLFGIKNQMRFHDRRHAATTRMIASGSPHTEVMKITGHTQLKSFLRYLNITPETARTVASRLNYYLADKQIKVDEASISTN
ncbi:MAG TPA: tyrosine-type recombinase/integrase [Pyrinomonadaceae bacterium]